MTDKLYPRWQTQAMKNAVETRRVILLTGSRQCGKTTLARRIAFKNSTYRTLDDLAIREVALMDPHGFVQHQGKMLIIDEIQRAPDLLSAIKLVVDEDTRPGQFLLTGSTNIQSVPSIRESLAGRIRKIRLRTLTQGELLKANTSFLETAFSQTFQEPETTYNRRAILEFAFRGGYPEVLEFTKTDRKQWHKDYMSSLLDRDLADITHIQRMSAMRKLIAVLSAWSGKLMDVSAIGAGLSIHRPTVLSYMNALEALYITETVQPWVQTDYARVGKQEKIYMTDTGLMTSLLNWNIDQVELDADRSGKLIETFVFNELAAQIDTKNGGYELFQYRDREQREIDFIIEREDQALLGIEVKAGSAISESDFKHLKWFKDNIAKEKPFVGVVLYTGQHLGVMGKDMWAVPFGCLWPPDV